MSHVPDTLCFEDGLVTSCPVSEASAADLTDASAGEGLLVAGPVAALFDFVLSGARTLPFSVYPCSFPAACLLLGLQEPVTPLSGVAPCTRAHVSVLFLMLYGMLYMLVDITDRWARETTLKLSCDAHDG